MGVNPRMSENKKVSYIGRNPAASPATGSINKHLEEQREIIEKVLVDNSSEIFQTDLWSINMDHDTSSSDDYMADITLFLLEEDDLWETIDLIHDIYNDNDIKNEETL